MLIELAQGIVQPGDKECHTVPVQDGYVMVKIDFVPENAKDVALPIPLPEADIYALGDARTMRIQWKKSGILIPPLVSRQLVVPQSGHAPQHLILKI